MPLSRTKSHLRPPHPKSTSASPHSFSISLNEYLRSSQTGQLALRSRRRGQRTHNEIRQQAGRRGSAANHRLEIKSFVSVFASAKLEKMEKLWQKTRLSKWLAAMENRNQINSNNSYNNNTTIHVCT